MILYTKLVNRLRSVFLSGKAEAELADEMQFHLDMEIEKHRAAGLSERAARRKAHLAFGSLEKTKEDCRDSWGVRVLFDLIRNVRYGMRRLFRNLGFSTSILLALGLCIGGSAAVFTVLHALVYKELPFESADRLVEVNHVHARSNPEARLSSNPSTYLQYAEESESFDAVSLHTTQWTSLVSRGRAFRAQGARVTGGFFDVARAEARIGSLRLSDSVGAGLPAVALTESFWLSTFNGDRSILGERVQIGGADYAIFGVVSDDIQILFPQVQFFAFWDTRDANAGAYSERREFFATLWARLRSGVSTERAELELRQLDDRFYAGAGLAAQEDRKVEGFETRVSPLRDLRNEWVRPKLFLLLGMSGVILVIGIVNIVNLLLAYANANARAIQVRETLGATRRRIHSQYLTEVALLAALGWGVSVVAAILGIGLLKTVSPEIGQYQNGIQFGGTSLLYSGALSLVSCLVMYGALVSNLMSSGSKRKSRSHQQSMGRGARRAASALVVAQIVMSFALLVGAGLLGKSFYAALNQDTGYNASGVVTARIELPEERYSDGESISSFRDGLLRRIEQLSAVESAAVATQIPTFGYPDSPITTPETKGRSLWKNPKAQFAFVSEGYFETLGMSLVDGRGFEPTDGAFWQEANVVEVSAVDALFPGKASALGAFFKPGRAPGNPNNWNRVVGVVENARHERLDTAENAPLIYRPIRGAGHREFSLLVKTPLPEDEAISLVRKTLLDSDPLLPVFRMGSLEGFMSESLAPRKGILYLVGAYALLALFLSTTGIFGLLAYDVSTRVKEFGIRISIGASRRQVLWQVMQKGLWFAAVGLGIGFLGALGVSGVIRQFLYSTSPMDATVYLGIGAILFGTILLACVLPARRAVRVDPLVALRQE